MSTEPPHPLTHTCFDCYLQAVTNIIACPLHATEEEREKVRRYTMTVFEGLKEQRRTP